MKTRFSMLAAVTLAAVLTTAVALAAPQGAPVTPPKAEREQPVLTSEQERLRDFSMVQNFVMTIGTVEGAPLRTYRDSGRKTTCYFWKASVSCVRD